MTTIATLTASAPIDPEPGVLEDLQRAASELEGAPPQEILAWGFRRYHPNITLACSFGGTAGMALLDMSVKIEPRASVFYLDTDFLFPETYALKEECERRYGIKVAAYKSRWTPEAQAREFGAALWARDPDLCCQLRKVEPNWNALEGKKAWISGLRRDQASTRAQTAVVEWDYKFGLVKLNPLAAWSEADVRAYLMEHNVPYNPLNDRGFPSLGCTYCTRAVKPGEDPRAGRWAGTDKVECGIHVFIPKDGQRVN